MPDSGATTSNARYDVFLAHAGCDTDPAKELFAALEQRGLRPYVDAENLLLGDAWDSRLSEAQEQSAVTAVLISKEALDPPGGRPAHYWLEEISSAIELVRNDPDGHRVVPVYLQGYQAMTKGVPYGLRRLNSLFLEDIDSAADAFVGLIRRLELRSEERPSRQGESVGEQHDLLIDIVDEELRFIHLSGGRIAESLVRYDPEMLEALQEAAPHQAQYDERVAAVAAKSLLPSKVRNHLAALDVNDRVRLLLSDDIWHLPWELLLLGGLPLSLRCATSRQPRGTDSVWQRRQGVRRPKVLVFTSASVDHPGVTTEAEGAEKAWADTGASVRLLRDPNLLQLEEALGKHYDVIHFAGHAWFERDGESYLGLCERIKGADDGYHYTVTRLLEALDGALPTVACINSHFTAFVGPVFRPDTSVMPDTPEDWRRVGFARPLLKAGVSAFVGAYGSPKDLPASHFGVQFNEELARGATVGEAAFGGRQWARVGGVAAADEGAEGYGVATVASYIVAGDSGVRVTDGSQVLNREGSATEPGDGGQASQ